ncbi:MAG TPA: hypothetical protein P5188_04675 [Flavobacterium sp.]|jgi:hypothetical protein|nr:hypothetical protein [Flavobacterium sp.]HRZ31581.1 hypothetical protein [Flavobacterium sp.]
MKNIILIIITFFTLISCNKDEENAIAEIDKLPPATQIGANTFGCLLDGKAFLPGTGSNPLDCVYQFVNGGFYFTLQANKRDNLNNRITIVLATNNLQILEGNTYVLLDESIGNAVGKYSYATNSTYTSSTHTGELTITKLNDQIISGTFRFDIIDYQGTLRSITNGRFDMQYTN